MKKPYTTLQIRDFYSDYEIEEIESYTCSVNCIHCKSRIWFHRDLYDETSPANFNCPSCDKVTINEYKIYQLKKDFNL
jgi:hypothetical protein